MVHKAKRPTEGDPRQAPADRSYYEKENIVSRPPRKASSEVGYV